MVAKQSTSKKLPKIVVRPIGPEDWSLIENLFGPRGACGGCWCMTWRVPKGGKTWTERTGEQNRRDFQRLVKSGRAQGCLAFVDDEAVGWCSIGPRADFPRIERTKAFATEWDESTWSVTCFFILPAWRGIGVATALLKGATKLAKSLGARELQGYPVKLTQGPGVKMPGAFAWTGIPSIFERQKFVQITLPGETRSVYRKKFRK